MKALVRLVEPGMFKPPHPYESRPVEIGDIIQVDLGNGVLMYLASDDHVYISNLHICEVLCKVGDRVRLIAEDELSRRWDSSMVIPRFTEVEISDFAWTIGRQRIVFFWNDQQYLVSVDEVEVIGDNPSLCTCDLPTLMSHGCQCGGV